MSNPNDLPFFPTSSQRDAMIEAFLDSVRLIDEVPPGKYTMWAASADQQRFSESEVVPTIENIYEASEGYESFILARLVTHFGLVDAPVRRIHYAPDEMLDLPIRHVSGEEFILTISQEKGIRFHFATPSCGVIRRVEVLSAYLGFVRAVRSEFAGDMDPPWDPRALGWWQMLAAMNRKAESDGGSIEAVGTIENAK
jgi:hypothetical protein